MSLNRRRGSALRLVIAVAFVQDVACCCCKLTITSMHVQSPSQERAISASCALERRSIRASVLSQHTQLSELLAFCSPKTLAANWAISNSRIGDRAETTTSNAISRHDTIRHSQPPQHHTFCNHGHDNKLRPMLRQEEDRHRRRPLQGP